MTDVLVIGGGQAGLATSYHLKQQGIRHLVLDAGRHTGDSWRERYDSLKLFTPTQHSLLPALSFPARRDHHPTKDEVANYLQAYREVHGLPVKHGARVVECRSEGASFKVRTEVGETFTSQAVVVATGPFQKPFTPHLSQDLSPGVLQLHSSGYQNPSSVTGKRVLVVGGGNSGFQIAEELSEDHQVTVAIGKKPSFVPQRILGRDVFDWLDVLGFMDKPPHSLIGRILQQRDPVIGSTVPQLVREGKLAVTSRIVGVQGGLPVNQEGQTLQVDTVLWATGFRPDYSWLSTPVVRQDGQVLHREGVTPHRGLYFVGLSWQRSRRSALIGGVGRDALLIAQHLKEHLKKHLTPSGAV